MKPQINQADKIKKTIRAMFKRNMFSKVYLGLFVAIFATLGTYLIWPSHAAVPAGFVYHQANKLYLNGQPYRFTGFNIYGANTSWAAPWGQCGYDWNDGTKLSDALTAQGSGTEVFRAWFFQKFATNSSGARDWSRFDKTLAVAASHNVKVIVTLANQWSDCDGYGQKDPTWYTSGYKTKDPTGSVSYREYAQEIVSRYKDNPNILAWQLINEGEDSDHAGFKAWATDMSALIKNVDPNHLVSIGTMGSGQAGAQATDYQDLYSIPTVDLCEYHDYTPNSTMPGDAYNGLQTRINQCNALGKPLFVGETGIKPSDLISGKTYGDRANAFDAKFSAQFTAGVVGELVWDWDTASSLTDYGVGAGDPILVILGKYAANNRPSALPTVSLIANPLSVTSGSTSNLTWSSTNATSCTATASPGTSAWAGDKPTSGSASTGTINTNTSYVLNCSGAGGSAQASATVTINSTSTPAPTVFLIAPGNNAAVSGSIPVSAKVSNATKVEFYADGTLFSTVTSSPYSTNWNAAGLPTGSAHTLQAKAYNAGGIVGASNIVPITIANPGDTIPPSVVISSPANGSQLSGTISIRSSATDNIDVASMDLYIDGSFKASSTTGSLSYGWRVNGGVKTGNHVILVQAYDAAGNLGYATVTVTR